MTPGNASDVFLSYHWRDHAHVEELAHALRKHDLQIFLDRWYLSPGRPWPQELQAALGGCRAVAVCVGPGEMGPWQQREANMALERQAREPSFPVIPVLLPGAEPTLGFLGQNTWIDLRGEPNDPSLIATLAGAIRGEAPGPYARERIDQTLAAICPFRGLLYFREEDAPFFFGRTPAITQLRDAVTRQSFIALVGASGTGKSSVVRAGLVPALRRDRERVWEIATLLPGDRPLHALAGAFVPLLEPDMTETDRLVEIGKMASALERGDLRLRDAVERVLAKQTGTNRLLLVADQWEELYTLGADEAVRRRFVDQLLEASAQAPLWVVLTLRGDFVGHALAYRPLSDRLQGAQVNLGPMSRAELALAIEEPARKVGLAFEPGLVLRMLEDAGDEPGNLPLLEFVLKQLWDNRSSGQLLHAAYEAMGRLQGALATKADAIFKDLSSLEQQAAERIFLQLATPAEQGDYARRRARLIEIGAASMQVLKRLTDERLLVTSHGVGAGEDTVEVSHEALMRHWDKLKSWLDADREFLLWRRRFGEFLGAWRADRTQEGTLLTGTFLIEAEKWLSERGERLSEEERQYIAASVAHRTLERKRTRVRTQAFVMAVAVFGVLALLFALNSQSEKSRATAAATRSLALQLAAQSGQIANNRLAEALLLGVAAIDLEVTHETKNNLFRILSSRPSGLPTFVWGHQYPVRSIAFSPNGQILATGSGDGTTILWDVASRKRLGTPLEAHEGPVFAIAFSADGKTLATGSRDGGVVLWDVASRTKISALKHPSGVWSVAFCHDGETLATADIDGTVFLWNLTSHPPVGAPLLAHRGPTSVACSADGKTLATAGNVASLGRTYPAVILWDVVSRKVLGRPISGNWGTDVWSVALSPDGNILAVGVSRPVTFLYNVRSHELVGTLEGHSRGVFSLAFGLDGRTLATGSLDHTVTLWDVNSRKPLGEPLKGHAEGVTSVAFRPDGRSLATGSVDGAVMLWDIVPPGPLARHTGPVRGVAFSANGKTLVTGSDDGTVALWDVATRIGKSIKLQGPVWGVAISPDGKLLASSGNGGVILRDLETGRPLGEPLDGSADGTSRVAFSPDGKTLAAGGRAGLILWDLATRERLGAPLGGRPVSDLAFSANGSLVAAVVGSRMTMVWNTASHKPLGEPFMGHEDDVSGVALSPDGKTLATGSLDRTAVLWNVANGERLGHPIKQSTKGVWRLDFGVRSVALSSDGSTLATARGDGAIALWDVATHHPLGEPFIVHDGPVLSVAFSPGGKMLVTGGEDGNVMLRDVSADLTTLKKSACEIVSRNFTLKEWQSYMVERPYRKICPDALGPGDPYWPFES